mmetsp:Transcript_2193/g.3288  ORF Transcript_2193/g.3288 Transcript_2193/m.3288 type:complete len:81 (-) Transcript_2193:1444-1686(-)
MAQVEQYLLEYLAQPEIRKEQQYSSQPARQYQHLAIGNLDMSGASSENQEEKKRQAKSLVRKLKHEKKERELRHKMKEEE